MIVVPLAIVWLFSPLIAYLLIKKERRARLEAIRSLASYSTDREKQREIFKYNNFEVRSDGDKLFVARKEFSFGKLFIGYFFAGVGMIVYLIYFLFFERAEEIEI